MTTLKISYRNQSNDWSYDCIVSVQLYSIYNEVFLCAYWHCMFLINSTLCTVVIAVNHRCIFIHPSTPFLSSKILGMVNFASCALSIKSKFQ